MYTVTTSKAKDKETYAPTEMVYPIARWQDENNQRARKPIGQKKPSSSFVVRCVPSINDRTGDEDRIA
jgi:hypothetical protein